MNKSRTRKKICQCCFETKQSRAFYKKKYSYDNVCMACRRNQNSLRYQQAEKFKRDYGLCNTEIMASKKHKVGLPWFDQYSEKMEAIRNAM
jgi:hypothetical protein